MFGYIAGPSIYTMPTSSLTWKNKPKLHFGGNNKKLHVAMGKSNQLAADEHDKILHDILCGRHEGIVYKQELKVRSFDIDSDNKLSTVALANYLQDTILNSGERMGIMSDGFATHEMSKRDLVWVTYKTDIAIDRFPSWHDIIQVQTWTYESRKNGLGVDWIFSDLETGKPLIRASRLCTMMNMKTRKLSKFTDEVKHELKHYLVPNCTPIVENKRKLLLVNIDKPDFTSLDLRPGWNDLDINQHVNNVKYIEWILEGVPSSIMGSHQLSSINLEFRKECDKNATLKSLSRYVKDNTESKNSTCNINGGLIEFEHSLRLDTGPEVARGWSIWIPKHPNQLG